MKIPAAAGYFKLFWNFNLAHMIKLWICKLSPSFKDQRELHMLHGMMSARVLSLLKS